MNYYKLHVYCSKILLTLIILLKFKNISCGDLKLLHILSILLFTITFKKYVG